MTEKHPVSALEELTSWGWSDLEPYFTALEKQPPGEADVADWLLRWTQVSEMADEIYNRLYVSTTVNTADKDAQKRFENFMGEIFPNWQTAEQRVKEKFLASGMQVAGFEIPLRSMRSEAALFRETNLPLFVKEEKLNIEHDKLMGAQTVQWQGKEKTARQMEVVLRVNDRKTRRQGWELLAQRQLADREAINNQWVEYMALRQEIAANADMPDYRAFRWRKLNRFEYTPEDCLAFHRAIEEAVVPVVDRMVERRKKALGIDRLRYYDLFVDLSGKPPLKPFHSVRELTDKASAIFHNVHPQFGAYFDTMKREGLLDLYNRKNKAAGGYCADFAFFKKPFIFANAVGVHEDVQVLLHEGGHSFHAFESFRLPYVQQRGSYVPMEFAEVASMGMEYLTSPYLDEESGGYYSAADAARAKVDHIETDLRFWLFMAVVDAFQHWVYAHPFEGADPTRCDEKWAELEKRFRPFMDWNGYEEVMKTGWQRKDHIHVAPFYYVEYGLALLGAVQVWRNAIADQQRAVEQYRSALALGATVGLSDLFKAAGAMLAFDVHTLRAGAALMEKVILELEEKINSA